MRPQRPGGKVGDCACIRMQDLGVFQERGVASKGVGCSFDPSGGSVRDPHRSSGWTEETLRLVGWEGPRKHREAGNQGFACPGV